MAIVTGLQARSFLQNIKRHTETLLDFVSCLLYRSPSRGPEGGCAVARSELTQRHAIYLFQSSRLTL